MDNEKSGSGMIKDDGDDANANDENKDTDDIANDDNDNMVEDDKDGSEYKEQSEKNPGPSWKGPGKDSMTSSFYRCN